MDEWEVYARVAVATALKAQEQGIAGIEKSRAGLHGLAPVIRNARQATEGLMRDGSIPVLPAAS